MKELNTRHMSKTSILKKWKSLAQCICIYEPRELSQPIAHFLNGCSLVFMVRLDMQISFHSRHKSHFHASCAPELALKKSLKAAQNALINNQHIRSVINAANNAYVVV